jgi:hypothetical protein
MRTLTKVLIGITAFPFLVLGFTYFFMTEAFKSGMDLCDNVLSYISRWLNK